MSIGERSTGPESRDEGDADAVVAAEPAPAPRRPGRPRALPLAEQRRLVVDAALRVFAADGYNGTTIERVAREAGTARSSVYELFQGKDDLFIAVVEDAAQAHGALYRGRPCGSLGVAGRRFAGDAIVQLGSPGEQARAGERWLQQPRRVRAGVELARPHPGEHRDVV